jgi:hypothetical protein
MNVDPSTRIIESTQRYKSAPLSDQFINVPLKQSMKELVEFDRTTDLSLLEVFDEERQQSTIFRPVTKFTILFENALTGSTTYVPYRDNLYYTNALQNAISYYPTGNVPSVPPQPTDQTVPWDGFPQYPEFDFIRTDNSVQGYTIGSGRHLDFKSVSATTYNWSHYLSYAYSNDPNKKMYAVEPQTQISWNWIASDGIPFYIVRGSELITNQITFKCPIKHNLSVGQFVLLSINYNNNSIFQVDGLGDGGSGSEEYIFSIQNVGYTGTTFVTLNQGTFRRVLDKTNLNDTISTYYVRRHRILTDSDCAVLVNAGYEKNVYNDKTKCEIKPLTPNQVKRTSVKEGSRSYTLSFNCDVNLRNLLDNQNRPISKLYFTTIWRGYFGWTQKLKQGWEFNTYLDVGKPQVWWDQNNLDSNTTINQSQYTSLVNQGPFFYNDLLTSGDTIDGDFCEWNNFEQIERTLSVYQHKITYNNNWFSLNFPTLNPTNLFGYFYQPHNQIGIREFSEYIEESTDQNIVDLPEYAYYSTLNSSFRWRDLYPYGFISGDGVGLDYPFLNNAHYPFVDTIFRITPENYNTASDYATPTNPNELSLYQGGKVPVDLTVIAAPSSDGCDVGQILFDIGTNPNNQNPNNQ